MSKYQLLRDSIHQLQKEAKEKGGLNPRSQMVLDLIADYDTLHTKLAAAQAENLRLLRVFIGSSNEEPYSLIESGIQRAIGCAPATLRDLGAYLCELLDENQWPEAEKKLMAAIFAYQHADLTAPEIELIQLAMECLYSELPEYDSIIEKLRVMRENQLDPRDTA